MTCVRGVPPPPVHRESANIRDRNVSYDNLSEQRSEILLVVRTRKIVQSV